MLCVETGCGGQVDLEKIFTVKIGGRCNFFAHPCEKCGRLHLSNGNGIEGGEGEKLFRNDVYLNQQQK